MFCNAHTCITKYFLLSIVNSKFLLSVIPTRDEIRVSVMKLTIISCYQINYSFHINNIDLIIVYIFIFDLAFLQHGQKLFILLMKLLKKKKKDAVMKRN